MTGAEERGTTVASPAAEYEVIGTRPVRSDGADKVTGKALFGTDIKLSGLLQGKILRSPHAHARIKSIDTTRAEALPGVVAVITARDLVAMDRKSPRQEKAVVAEQYAGELDEDSRKSDGRPPRRDASQKQFRDQYLASDKVLYRGHPIAAVAAIDQFVAEEAIGLIAIEFEELPPVLDLLEAMKDTSPLVHEDQLTMSLGKPGDKPSNISQHLQYIKGDPDKGLAEADIVIEREFRTVMVHQGYLEPHAVTATCSREGDLTVWSSHQGHFQVRDDIAKLLQHPVAKIQVIPTEIGGGFGGKFNTYVQPLAALLALKTGRPVRLAMSRAETFEATGPAMGSFMRLKVGATRDGRLKAVVAWYACEAGAFPGSSTGGVARCLFGAYDVPNGQIDGYEVVANKPKSAAYRAPGSTQATFAAELVIDEICEQIDMDPLEFRLKNAAKEGSRTLVGAVHPRVGYLETMKAAQAHEHYKAPVGGPNRGRGVACGWWPNHGGASSCNLNVNGDGTVSLATASIDLSGTRTSVAMQVAETLGIGLHEVHCDVADTNSVGYAFVSGGSRTTFATGIAAIQAANDVIRRMTGRAALIWQVSPESVAYARGAFTTSMDEKKRLTFKEVAAKLPTTGGPISVSSSLIPEGVGPTAAVHIVDVEVDPETGKVQILRYTALQDVGKAIHPSLVESQMQGGVAQGIGWALWEGYQFDAQGKLLNTSFLDYKMPTAYDLPSIDTVLVEVPNPGHPYGVRGVGEIPFVAPPAALALAIHRATGVRLRELPMAPALILQGMGVIP